MKTSLAKFKYYFGLGFAGLLVFSSFLTITMPPQQAMAVPGCPGGTADIPNQQVDCDDIEPGCPGSTPGKPATGRTANCEYYPVSGNWTCPVREGCKFPGNVQVDMGDPAPKAGDGGAGAGTTTPPPADGNEPTPSEDLELQCGTDWTQLSWYLCPVIRMVQKFVTGLDATINDLLFVDQGQIFGRSSGDTTVSADEENVSNGYKQAWSVMRTLALAILVIAALVMVASQALGFAILDAYTIKKILPRILVAIIGISLSWELMSFFVGFTNDLGLGINDLIYAPFRELYGDLGLNAGSIMTLVLGAGGGLLVLGIGGMLSFVLTAALAIIIAFLVLILRELVIIVLVLFAPIAIACYILPNTNGAWKIWYESFTKALMMFPIIVAFLSVGRVLAVVSMNRAATSETLDDLIGFIAYFLPYFLIPLTFSFAGGALRTLGGAVNNRSKGGFDRLKKYRGGRTAHNMEGMKEGKRFRPNSKLARGFNNTTSFLATAPSAGLNPTAMRSRYNAEKSRQVMGGLKDVMDSAEFQVGAQDDRLLRVAQYAKGRGDIRSKLEAEGFTGSNLDTAIGDVESMQSAGSADTVKAAIALQRFATGTGYNKTYTDANGVEHTEFDYQDAMRTIHDASGGDKALAGRLLGAAKGTAASAGQLGFGGASYGTLSGELNKLFDETSDGTVDSNKIALNAFESNDAASIAKARGPHVEAMTRAVNDRMLKLKSGATPRDAGELGRLTAQAESFRETAVMYGAPERQTIITNEMSTTNDLRREVKSTAVREETRYQQARDLNENGAVVYNIRTKQPESGKPLTLLNNDLTPGERIIIPEQQPAPISVAYMRNRNARVPDINDPRSPVKDDVRPQDKTEK